jgi:hypothetical protein
MTFLFHPPFFSIYLILFSPSLLFFFLGELLNFWLTPRFSLSYSQLFLSSVIIFEPSHSRKSSLLSLLSWRKSGISYTGNTSSAAAILLAYSILIDFSTTSIPYKKYLYTPKDFSISLCVDFCFPGKFEIWVKGCQVHKPYCKKKRTTSLLRN